MLHHSFHNHGKLRTRELSHNSLVGPHMSMSVFVCVGLSWGSTCNLKQVVCCDPVGVTAMTLNPLLFARCKHVEHFIFVEMDPRLQVGWGWGNYPPQL
jgi:hypothetical protein